MKFHTVLELHGKTATGFEVPAAVVTKLGSSKRPAVKVTINGFTYQSTVAVMGGRFMVGVSAENRKGAGVNAGDEVEVEIVADTATRTVTVPADFAKILKGDPKAKKAFEALAYSHRKEWIRSIEEAKSPETRQRRIDKAMAVLREKP
ncbi:MAG: hypothetical protein JWL70_762 [Acidimicrobiia bacterium]|nr:hypothetical protein [Acidimicrobiia bacterium]